MDIPLGKHDPQGAGSAITYAQRYALMASLGLPPLDDDAEGAMPRNHQSEPMTGRNAAGNPPSGSSHKPAPAATLSDTYRLALAAMKTSRSKAELREWWEANWDRLSGEMPENEGRLLIGERNTLGFTLPEHVQEAA